MKNKFSDMSNSEIKIKLIEMENEYESIKNNVIKQMERMEELDKNYLNGKNELKKRKVL